MSEHEIEPAPGIPEPMPEGEAILWQGAPSTANLAIKTFHVKAVMLYFTALIAWDVVSSVKSGDGPAAFVLHLALPVGLAIAAIGLLALFAVLMSRTTIYTITSKRVIMRCGIALPIVMNIPFSRIRSAAFAARRDGSGDITLSVTSSAAAGERISYIMLWPHVRPWRLAKAEPMLRGLRDVNLARQILGQALAAAAGQPLQPLRETARVPKAIDARNIAPSGAVAA